MPLLSKSSSGRKKQSNSVTTSTDNEMEINKQKETSSSTIPLTSELTQRLKSISRIEQSKPNHALQIVALQARVWVADENDEACRPWYMLCLEIYPRGKVINHKIHTPASQSPNASALLDFLLTHIENPPQDERSIRPTHVSFVDTSTANAIAPHLNRLKIKCETLTIADGVNDYISKFSERLIERGHATRGDSSERPGILSAHSVLPSDVTKLMQACVNMYSAKPWSRIPEHVALQVRMPCQEVVNSLQKNSNKHNNTTNINDKHNKNINKNDASSSSNNHNKINSNINGNGYNYNNNRNEAMKKPTKRYRDKFFVTVLGSDKKAYGFALVASLAMLRDKYRRVMGKRTGNLNNLSISDDEDEDDDDNWNETKIKPIASDIYVCAACGRRVGEEGPERYVNRCSACQRVLYCDEECQRKDWRERHREECLEARKENNENYVFRRSEWAWLDREVALLFLDPTAIPFDDLDGFEKHKWSFIQGDGLEQPPLYPLPFVSVQLSDGFTSKRDVPTKKEIEILTHVANALAECVSTPPSDGILHLSNGVSISLAENLAESIPVPL